MTRYIIALIAFGLVLLFWGTARADWQVQEWVGGAWVAAATPKGHPIVTREKTACELDLASLSTVKPSGTRLRCLKIK